MTNIDALNLTMMMLAGRRTSPILWRRSSGFFGPKQFEARFDNGARLELTENASAWGLVFYTSAGRAYPIATGSAPAVLERANVFITEGWWALVEVNWEDRGHYRLGWNPRARDDLAMIIYPRKGAYGAAFVVNREDPEHSFTQEEDDEYDPLLVSASLILVNGLPREQRPRPRTLLTSIGAFPCRLDLAKMRVVARCPRGSFAFVYCGPQVHELRFRDEHGVRHVLGTGPVMELLQARWTLPERPQPAPSPAPSPSSSAPTIDPRDNALIHAIAAECKQRGLLDSGVLAEDLFTTHQIHLAIDAAAQRVGIKIRPDLRSEFEKNIREAVGTRATRFRSDDKRVLEATAREMPSISATPTASADAARTTEPKAVARLPESRDPAAEAPRSEVPCAERPKLGVGALRELLIGHLDLVLARVPAKKPGASSARRLVAAFVAAFDDGHADIEGTYAEVLDKLLPYLDRQMSVRAAIDAFALLDPLTPLLERKHSRCLTILVGQARDPGSPVVAALLELRRRR